MKHFATFNRFEIELTREQADTGSHKGRCDEDVAALVREPEIVSQLDAINPDTLRAELKEYGAWDANELADDAQNRQRIVWLAAGQISDELRS